jgi:hypothetical protein
MTVLIKIKHFNRRKLMTCKTCAGSGWIGVEAEPYLSGYVLVDEEVEMHTFGSSDQEDYPSGYVIQSEKEAFGEPCPDCLQNANSKMKCPDPSRSCIR